MTLYALASTRHPLNVLCGACKKTIAFRQDQPDESPVPYFIVLPEGWWRGDDGVWELSNTAKKQRDRRDHQGRRFPLSASSRPDRAARDKLERAHVGAGQERRPYRVGFALTELPVDVRCTYNRCGQRQALDGDRLEAGPAPKGIEIYGLDSRLPGALLARLCPS